MAVVYSHAAIVVGSGAAGLNAALRLYDYGVKDVAIVTDGFLNGTSRNAGSDKQTYYKLSLQGGRADSVESMAETLFSGGCTDGDNALAEAAGSVQCFFRLVEAGVPFPYNRYGEFPGYKTDHDPRTRATSVGPLTSKQMAEALGNLVIEKGIKVYDGWSVADLICRDGECHGITAVNKEGGFAAFSAGNTVMATGAPAGMYARSVYPESQNGATGAMIRAGVEMQNLAEWQYGLASTKFRWNLSGTYQQCLPRYVSTRNGVTREFLRDSLSDEKIIEYTFLKGYQWPFDSAKVNGSSLIDVLVHRECEAGGQVALDFTHNPSGLDEAFGILTDEARNYIKNSGGLIFDSPFARLIAMNPKAIELYRSHGIDIANELLDIAVCAQHNNGGAAVDVFWKSVNTENLYIVGEAAGTHGLRRPGGSALNSGQVGSMRAARNIAAKQCFASDEAFCLFSAAEAERKYGVMIQKNGENYAEIDADEARSMSNDASQLRETEKMEELCRKLDGEFKTWFEKVRAERSTLSAAVTAYNMCACRAAYCHAMLNSAKICGSRGGAVCMQNGKETPEITEMRTRIQTLRYDGAEFVTVSRPVRPMPEADGWFERVWAAYSAGECDQ